MKFLFSQLNLKKFFESNLELQIQDISTFPDKIYYIETGYFMPITSCRIQEGTIIVEKACDWVLAAKKLQKESINIVIHFEDRLELLLFERQQILTNLRQIADVAPGLFGESAKSTHQVVSFNKTPNDENIQLIKKEISQQKPDLVKNIRVDDNRLILETTSNKDFADKTTSANFVSLCLVIDSIEPIRSLNGSTPKWKPMFKSVGGT